MTLTLSVTGGFTGLTKQHSINTDSLDPLTREALMNYINSGRGSKTTGSIVETWTVDDQKEVFVERHQLPSPLKELYDEMRSNLRHKST